MLQFTYGQNSNPQQLEAIQHQTGPLLVIAGAGTGKQQLSLKGSNICCHFCLALPNEILALTFTEKAATEMQDRLDEVMPLGYSKCLSALSFIL